MGRPGRDQLPIEVRPLRDLRAADLAPLTGPYTCHQTYRVTYSDSPTETSFNLELVDLQTPYIGRYEHIDDAWVEAYLRKAEFSYGAYEGNQLLGVLIADRQAWNSSLFVHEFHVAAERRGQGVGRLLMEHAAAAARAAGLRIIVCETQARNANAIQAYRKLGFRPEAVDISLYTNRDYPGDNLAVFMKRRL